MAPVYKTLLAMALFSSLVLSRPSENSHVRKRQECPAPTSSPTPEDPSNDHGDEPLIKVFPEFHDIFPELPDFSRPLATGIHLESYENSSQVEQVAVFRGIPAGATSCRITSWQADKPNRVMVVSNPGAATTGATAAFRIYQMSDFASGQEPLTYASIGPHMVDNPLVSLLDYTNWDVTPSSRVHGGGNVTCAEEVYVRLAITDTWTVKNIYLQQDEMNGLYLDYSL